MNDLFQNFSFIFTADNYKNLPASHDRSDSHGICLFWNILFAVKESFVGLNRSFSQIYAVSLVFKMVGWFIKTNMSIVTKPDESGYQLDRSCEAVRYMPGMLFQHLVLCRSERMYLHG